VLSIIQDNSDNFVSPGGFFRISSSRAAGFEDVFGAETTSDIHPGYVDSQHHFGYEQFGGTFTLAPLVDGDYDFDGDVDGADFLKWQQALGSADSVADGDDDGMVDGDDLVIWQDHFGETAETTAAATTVPEPGSLALLLTMAFFVARRRRIQ
jgi:hypothetical protein